MNLRAPLPRRSVQVRLTILLVRSMALAFGRGALTLGTLRPLPTEPLPIPPLSLAGRLVEQARG